MLIVHRVLRKMKSRKSGRGVTYIKSESPDPSDRTQPKWSLIQIIKKKSYNCIHIKYMQKHNFSYMQLNNPTNTLRSFLTLETAKQSLHNVHPVAVELSIRPHDLQRWDQVTVLQVPSQVLSQDRQVPIHVHSPKKILKFECYKFRYAYDSGRFKNFWLF